MHCRSWDVVALVNNQPRGSPGEACHRQRDRRDACLEHPPQAEARRNRNGASTRGVCCELRAIDHLQDWRYLERDWVATAGSYLFEPPGDVHTLVVDEGDAMITLFHNTGALLYCDEQGRTIGSTDVFDRVAAARRHFEAVGLGADYVKRFIR